jgi:sugar phosphate isomerase/epimerase
VLSLAPPEMVSVAARTGYRHVGLRLIGVSPDGAAYPLMSDRPMMRETKMRLADTGLEVLDIEFVRLAPDTDPRSLVSFLEAGAELGARYVVTAPYDADPARLSARFAELCDLAAPLGLGVVLEFYPWTVVASLSGAAAIVAAADRPNGGILVDTLHFARTDSRLQDLEDTPAARLPFLHLADAPAEVPATAEALIHTARSERLPPGEGGIDIPAIVRRMPAGIPIALEVPMDSLSREIGPEGVARRVRKSAARLLHDVESGREEFRREHAGGQEEEQ